MIHLASILYHIVPFPVKISPFYFHLNPCLVPYISTTRVIILALNNKIC